MVRQPSPTNSFQLFVFPSCFDSVVIGGFKIIIMTESYISPLILQKNLTSFGPLKPIFPREFVLPTHQISHICTPYTISLQFSPLSLPFSPILWYLNIFSIFSKLALFPNVQDNTLIELWGRTYSTFHQVSNCVYEHKKDYGFQYEYIFIQSEHSNWSPN